MPLVFVHGVNTREGATDKEKAEFRGRIDVRDELFRTIGLAGLIASPGVLHIENPYWGGHAATFTHDLASVPGSGIETFGAAAPDDAMAEVLSQTLSPMAAERLKSVPETGILLALARQKPEATLPLAVDALVAAAASQSAGGDEIAARQELGRFAAAAMTYLQSKPNLDWLFAKHPATGELLLKDDDQLLDALEQNLKPFLQAQPGPEHFGGSKVLDWLKGVASALGTAAKKTVTAIAATGIGAAAGAAAAGAPFTGAAIKLIRPIATQRAGIFLGDVFAYLNRRGDKNNPGDIVKVVCKALREGASRRTNDDSRLLVIAHSMGGNIVYDILTYFDPEIKVDALVTVGSQVALFKELQLYVEDKEAPTAPGLVKKPDGVGIWVNVFDPLDVLGFAASGVFEEVVDYAFSSQASPLDAHSTYFLRPSFHERLRARLAEGGLGVAT